MSTLASSRSSSGSPPAESTVESPTVANSQIRKTTGPRRKRRGKLISRLREAYSLEQPNNTQSSCDQIQAAVVKHSKLNPSLTVSHQLAAFELRTALNHSLIVEAWKTLEMLHAPGWHELSPSPLHTKFSTASIESEVITAALIAVGAMTSTHSAIVGECTRLSRPHSPDELVALNFGRRREPARRVLASRAVQIARDSGVLDSPDARSSEVCSVLRSILIFCCRDDDDFVVELRDSLRLRREFPTVQTRERWMLSFLASDAFAGLMLNGKIQLSDKELAKFGLKDVTAAKARARLRKVRDSNAPVDEHVLRDSRHAGIVLLREVVRMEALPVDCALDELIEQLERHYATLDLILFVLARVPAHILERQSFRYHLLLKIPMMLESTMCAQITRHVQARPDSERAKELGEEAQQRFLASLARAVDSLDQEEMSSVSPQVTATLWSALDVFSEWDELAIDGARQHGRGEGPLAGAGFGWEQLRTMHTFLKISTATFASSAEKEKRFRVAWEERQVEMAGLDVQGRLEARPARRRGADSERESAGERVAARMVNQALVEVTA